jgi:trans-2,3-dihydro-3-hydroxyanthranilate isomerase
MKSLRLYILDVFTTERFSGNPLAVVVSQKELSKQLMLKIAKEMNYSGNVVQILKGKINEFAL